METWPISYNTSKSVVLLNNLTYYEQHTACVWPHMLLTTKGKVDPLNSSQVRLISRANHTSG